MKAVTFFLLVVAFRLAAQSSLPFKVHEVPVAPGFSKTSVNATIFRTNSIASHKGFQYLAYYDSTATVVLAKRRLGKNRWQLHQTQYKGNVRDAHNIISIMVDGDGYLHMAWDHHNNQLKYCRSVAPESLQLGKMETMIGTLEDKVTYPEFHWLPSGNLIFIYRDGSSGDGNIVMNAYDLKKRKWERRQSNLINGEGDRNAYWQLHVSKSGKIHLSWVWREDYHVETNHDMGYAVSIDEGRTWRTSEGKQYQLPITMENAEYAARIPQQSDLINQTSITANAKDQPFIATYFQGKEDCCPQYYVITKQNGQWITIRASDRKMDFNLGGAGTRSIPISRPKILVREKEGKQQLIMVYRDAEFGDKVCLSLSDSTLLNWSTNVVTNDLVDRWEPSYDTELWKQGKLHLYVQKVGQESGEKAVAMSPQMIKVLEIEF
jgi:hypothetical protein